MIRGLRHEPEHGEIGSWRQRAAGRWPRCCPAALAGGRCSAADDPAPGSAAPWQLSVTPYVWGTALKGDVGVGRTSADVDASFSDILDNLNGALMLSLELRKGRFGLLSDSVYANLEDDGGDGARSG